MRAFALAVLMSMALAWPASAQAPATRDIIVPVLDANSFEQRLQRTANQNEAEILTDTGLSPSYRVVRAPEDRVGDILNAMQPWYRREATETPIDVGRYLDLAVPLEPPVDGTPQRRDFDVLQRAFGEEDVQFGQATPPRFFESTPLEGQRRFTVRAFDQQYTISGVLTDGAVRLTRGDGRQAVLYASTRHIDEREVSQLDIIDGDDVVLITPIDREGHATFVRLRNAAAAPDHTLRSPVNAERILTDQRDRSRRATPDIELPRPGVRGPGCDIQDDHTIVIGWLATQAAWSVLNGSGFTTIEQEADHFRAALTAAHVQGGVKVFPLSGTAASWAGSSTEDTANLISTGDARMAPLWRLANEGCADILVLVTSVPLSNTTGAIPDCGNSAVFATPATAGAVVNIQCFFAERHTLAHEIGHVFGGCHDENPQGIPERCDAIYNNINYQFRFGCAGDWPDANHRPIPQGDLMAGWHSTLVQNGFKRNDFFSEPPKCNLPSPRTNVGELIRQRFDTVAKFYEMRIGRSASAASS